jgi:hypothetical protein
MASSRDVLELIVRAEMRAVSCELINDESLGDPELSLLVPLRGLVVGERLGSSATPCVA